MSIYEDHPTLVDSLDRVPLVTRLAAEVMTCTPPRVYGVHGDWGSGKTSFLHQLHETLGGIQSREDWMAEQKAEHEAMSEVAKRLAIQRRCRLPERDYHKESPVLVVWFEAWRYQHEPAPVVALLHEMRGQLGILARLRNETLKLGEVAIRSSLLQLEQIAKFALLQSAEGITTSSGGLVATIQDQGERWERQNLAEKLPAEAMREQLEHAIGQLLGRVSGPNGAKKRRVVVIIDDLDRCEPHATFRLLEGIKIYLNIPNCVFVLGMDQRVIEDAIAESSPGDKQHPNVAKRRAREYLEKLFQEIYHLPMVPDVPNQLSIWLKPGHSIHNAARANLMKIAGHYPECLPANPRKIKAFAGVLRRVLEQHDPLIVQGAGFDKLVPRKTEAGKEPVAALILIVASLYHFHPEMYRALEAHGSEFFERLWNWCARHTGGQAVVHDCFELLDPAYMLDQPVDRAGDKYPPLISLLPDYSRGNVLRCQRLIYESNLYTSAQIRSLLLR